MYLSQKEVAFWAATMPTVARKARDLKCMVAILRYRDAMIDTIQDQERWEQEAKVGVMQMLAVDVGEERRKENEE